ncbi:MAG: HIT domain-containing protein [Bacteroidota bacterium]
MRRLYSPWRSQYINTFKHGSKPAKCLFCRIAKEKKDAQNLVVWRGKLVYVVLNRFPYNSGHVMVVPYKHTADFSKLTASENTELMSTTSKCLKVFKKLNGPHGFNFGANLGRVAGAGIEDHIHFHIVPRWNGDTNFMPVVADTKVISEDLKVLADRMRKAMK